MAEKKIFQLSQNCRLYPSDPCEQKMSLQWLVWYYVSGVRKQKKGNINQFNTVAERITAAQRLAYEIEKELFLLRRKAINNTSFVCGLQQAFKSRCKALRAKSVSSYKTKVNAFVKYLCENLIENPTKETATNFFNDLKSSHANTHAVYRVVLFSLVEDMRKSGLVYENIFSHIKIKKREMQPKWFFTNHQISRLKNKMLEMGLHQLWLACQMQYYGLLRPTELRGIKVGDFLFDENKLLVRADISKNKKNEFVVLPAKLITEIQQHTKHKSDNDYLFTGATGKQFGANYFYSSFRKVLVSLHMDTQKHSFYSWKHTGARAWVKSGGSVYGLMRQMRHHSLDMTQLYLRKLGILEFEDDVNAMPVI